MNMPIPSPDVAPLPAPVWLLHFLLVFTFGLHMLFALTAVGASLMSAVYFLAGPKGRALAKNLTTANMVNISLAITSAIAPLLFVQVLYGPVFYTSTVLLAWPWIAIFAILILAYYSTYLFKYRPGFLGNKTGLSWLLGLVAVLGFLFVGSVHVFNSQLYTHPGHWPGLAARPVSLWPRLVHFLLASVIAAGVFAGAVGMWRSKSEPKNQETHRWMAKQGALWVMFGLVAQILAGTWRLFALEPNITKAFVGGELLPTLSLGAAGVLVLAALGSFWLARDPLRRPKAFWTGAALLVINMIPMAYMRDVLRLRQLADRFNIYSLKVSAQWDLVLLFAVVLTVCLGLVAWITHRIVSESKTHKPKEA